MQNDSHMKSGAYRSVLFGSYATITLEATLCGWAACAWYKGSAEGLMKITIWPTLALHSYGASTKEGMLFSFFFFLNLGKRTNKLVTSLVLNTNKQGCSHKIPNLWLLWEGNERERKGEIRTSISLWQQFLEVGHVLAYVQWTQSHISLTCQDTSAFTKCDFCTTLHSDISF